MRRATPAHPGRWKTGPETGFKVGVASGRVLAKLVGTLRKPDEQEPVWAGTPVNYAAKAAQQADRHQLIVTDTVWRSIQHVDYLRFSCGCLDGRPGDPTDALWAEVQIERIPEGRPDRAGRRLATTWCDNHGPAYVEAILAGERRNPEMSKLRSAASLEAVHAKTNASFSARRRGLS